MALIKCKECGREISDKASVCPHCGCPVELDDAGQESEFDDTEQEGRRRTKEKKGLVLAFALDYCANRRSVFSISDDVSW